jgi:hypothetical protein
MVPFSFRRAISITGTGSTGSFLHACRLFSGGLPTKPGLLRQPAGSRCMTTRTEWTGTASELLGGLAEQVGGTQRKSKSWPNARRALAGRLRRAATFLRKVGIPSRPRQKTSGRDRPHRPQRPPQKLYHCGPTACRRPDGGRCCGRSPARYRRNRPHQLLKIQCGDRCGRCGRKWRPPFWCSGIAACLNEAVHGCQRILYQLAKGFALDIPWSWRLREGGE